MQHLDIFNELSEHITLRINSRNEDFHDRSWLERKIHIDNDIWIVTSGNVVIETGGSSYTACVGDAVFFYPGISYTARTNAEECSFIYIHFDFGIGNNFKVLKGLMLSGIISRELVHEEARMVRTAFDKYRNREDMSAMLFKGCLFILIARILEISGKGIYAGSFPAEAGQGHTAQKLAALEPVFIHINRNIHKPILMSELSAVVNMSEKYFITCFKNALGITPGQYIYQLKMNRAREYIYRKSFSLKEIANRLGYPDQYAFSKAFKKYYNVPPSKFT